MEKVNAHNNLKALYPALATQWHPSKNGKLTPERVTPDSQKKIWWMCGNGHEWQAKIPDRCEDNRCPNCSMQAAEKGHNLQAVNPELAEQWHPTKNGDLTPRQVTPNSGIKVWWRCSEGHEWQAMIDKRSRGGNCPYCAGLRVTKSHNFLALFPQLAKQWHPTKNGELTPDKVPPHTSKKVWWLCKNGHEWRAEVTHRSNGGGRCPKCTSKIPNRYSNLLKSHPELARQWHPSLNGELEPEQVTSSSSRKAWWMCEKGHEWQDKIIARREGNDCPYCYGPEAVERYNLADLYPAIAKEWCREKNNPLAPENIAPSSGKKVWWRCGLGHEWKAAVGNRVQGTRCPYCHGRYASEDYNLELMNPALAAQWHPEKNGKITPRMVTPGSSKKAWWMCEKGHEWQTVIKYRRQGSNCPYCAGKKSSKDYNLKFTHPTLAAQWHPEKNGPLTPEDVTPGSDRIVWWLCTEGHEFEASVNVRAYGRACPHCYRLKRNWKINR